MVNASGDAAIDRVLPMGEAETERVERNDDAVDEQESPGRGHSQTSFVRDPPNPPFGQPSAWWM